MSNDQEVAQHMAQVDSGYPITGPRSHLATLREERVRMAEELSKLDSEISREAPNGIGFSPICPRGRRSTSVVPPYVGSRPSSCGSPMPDSRLSPISPIQRPTPVHARPSSIRDADNNHVSPTSGPRHPAQSTPAPWGATQRYTKPKTPAEYDGKSSFQDYLVHFEMVSDLNGWDQLTRALELATSLRGQAQSVLSDLTPEERRDFISLVKVLTWRFEPDNLSEIYRAQLKGRERHKDEALPVLCHDLKKLVRKAHPGAPPTFRDTIATDSFIDALGNEELEWAVHQAKPKTIDQALQAALEYEAFQTARRRRKTSVAPVRSIDQSIESRNIPQRGAQKNRGKGRPNHTNCFYCNGPNHYIANCGKRMQDEMIAQSQAPASIPMGNTQAGQRTHSGNGN